MWMFCCADGVANCPCDTVWFCDAVRAGAGRRFFGLSRFCHEKRPGYRINKIKNAPEQRQERAGRDQRGVVAYQHLEAVKRQ